MNIRNLKVSELEKLDDFFDVKESFINYIEKMMEDKVIKPEWCFVSEEDNILKSIIIYAVFDSELEILYFNINDFNSKYSLDILPKSLNRMKEEGFDTVGIHIYSDKKNYIKYIDTLKNNYFNIIQEKKSFILECNQKDKYFNRLHYKTLKEVGKDFFIEKIKDVTVNTLDQEDLDSIRMYGDEKAAIKYFNELKIIDYNPEMWKLGYDKDEIVGLVIPQVFDKSTGAINYIGVIPEKRGNAFINDLLKEGINSLNRKKINKIIADIDINNYPLERALVKENFKLDSKMFVLKLSLI
ncbi:MAG: hypothetical protein ACQESN_07605 [Thermotogota bacterium]